MSERIALVTGGSRGLGKNAVLKLAAEGTGIILTWNNSQQEAQEVVREIEGTGGKAAALQLNVGKLFALCSAGEGYPQTRLAT